MAEVNNLSDVDECEEEEGSDNEFYEVEAILDHEEITDSQNSREILGYKYKILWKGYPIEQSSWEKESNLQCIHILKNYKRNQGIVCRRGRPRGSKNKRLNDKTPNSKTGPRHRRTNSNYNFDEDFKPMIKYNLEASSSGLTHELSPHSGAASVDLYTRVKQRRADAENAPSSSGACSSKPSTFGDVGTKDSKPQNKTKLSVIEENIKTSETSSTTDEDESDDDDNMNETAKFLPPACNEDLDESDEGEEIMAPYGRSIHLTAEEIETNFCDDDLEDAKMDNRNSKNSEARDDDSSDDDEDIVIQPDLYLASPDGSEDESDADDDQTTEATSTETTSERYGVNPMPPSTLSQIEVKEEPPCQYASSTPKCKFAKVAEVVIKKEVVDDVIEKDKVVDDVIEKDKVVDDVGAGDIPDCFPMIEMEMDDMPPIFFDTGFDDLPPQPDLSEELPDLSEEVQPTPDLSEEVQPTPDLSEEVQSTPDLSEEVQPTPDLSEEVQPTTDLSEEIQPQPDLSEELRTPPTLFKKIKPVSEELQPTSDLSEELQPTSDLSEELQPTSDLSEKLQPISDLSEKLRATSTLFKKLKPAPTLFEELQPTSDLSEKLQPTPVLSEKLRATPTLFKKLKPAPKTLSEGLKKVVKEKEDKDKLTPKEKIRTSKSIIDEVNSAASPAESRKSSSNEERSAFDCLFTSIDSPTDTDVEPMLKPSRLSTPGGEKSAFSIFANLSASTTTTTGRGDENDGRIRLNDIRKKALKKKELEEQSKVENKVVVAKSSGEKTTEKPASSAPRKVDNKPSLSVAADRKTTTTMGSSLWDPRKRKLMHEDAKEKVEGSSAIINSSRARVVDGDKKKATKTTMNCNQKKQREMKELVSELPSLSKNKTPTTNTKRPTPSACDPRLNRNFTSPRRNDDKKTDVPSSSGRPKVEVHKSWKSRARPSSAVGDSGKRVSDQRKVVEAAATVEKSSILNSSAEVMEDSMSDGFSPRRRLDPFIESISILNKLTDPDGKELSSSELFHLEHNKEFFEEKVDLKLTRANSSKIKGFFEQTAAKKGHCLSFHHPGSVQIQVGERKDSNENFRKYVKENNVEKLKEALSSLDMYNLEHEGENFMTPLQIASVKGFNEIVEILCYAGTNVNMKNRNTHQTPLVMAIEKGHEVIVRTLFKYGATLNDVAKNGETALYKAVKRGSYNILKFLLTHGADVFCVLQDPVSRDPYIKPCIDAYLSYKQSAQAGIMKCIDHTVKKLRLRKLENPQEASPILLMRGFSIRENLQLDLKFDFPRERYQRSVPLMFAVHTVHDEESFQMKCRLHNECSVYGAFLNKVIMEPMYPETNTSNTHMVTYLDCRPGQNHLQLLIDQNSNSREVIYIVVCMVKYPKNF